MNDAEIKADTLEQAREQVDYLDELAQACIAKRAESRPDGSDDPQSTAPSPTPSASPSGSLPVSVPPSASVDPEDCG